MVKRLVLAVVCLAALAGSALAAERDFSFYLGPRLGVGAVLSHGADQKPGVGVGPGAVAGLEILGVGFELSWLSLFHQDAVAAGDKSTHLGVAGIDFKIKAGARKTQWYGLIGVGALHVPGGEPGFGLNLGLGFDRWLGRRWTVGARAVYRWMGFPVAGKKFADDKYAVHAIGLEVELAFHATPRGGSAQTHIIYVQR